MTFGRLTPPPSGTGCGCRLCRQPHPDPVFPGIKEAAARREYWETYRKSYRKAVPHITADEIAKKQN